LRLFRSSIGAKVVVALTGLLLFGFVIVHLLGNLQVFGGPDALNSYSEKLRELGPLLWIARIGLIVIAVAHVGTALKLMRANERARPVPYLRRADRQIRMSTRFMATSGLVLLGYVLFHLAHFTWGWVYPDFFGAEEQLAEGIVRKDVFAMLVHGFQVWWVVAAYLLAMLFLALHLWHGIPSLFQTLGVNHPKYDGLIRGGGALVAALVFAGYCSIPLAVIGGFVTLPGGTP
jgi:succinate dehydrogenase / fumarate reductase, cytochrome b subunit